MYAVIKTNVLTELSFVANLSVPHGPHLIAALALL